MDADQVSHLLELEDKLSKIRNQLTSKLENQKHIAIILTATEDNIKDYHTNEPAKNLVNYLVGLMSLLDQAMDPETQAIKDIQLASSTTYLLDIIFHYAPKKLLRSKFAEVLTKIAPCITDEKAGAPLIRAAIGCLESLLISQDAQAWNNTHNLSVTPKRGLQGLLELALDPRPKIRKRAQEAIKNILLNPPVAPTPEHVAASFIADFAMKSLADVLNEYSTMSNKKLKVQTVAEEIHGRIIKNLRLVSNIISTGQWPSPQIEPLCDMLLEVTKSSDQYMVSTAFQCFESMFASMAISTGLAEDKYIKVLDTIFSLRPSNNDTNLAGAWIAVVVKGMSTYASHQPLNALRKIPEVFEIMSIYLQSETPEITYSGSQCLIAILTDAVKDEILLSPPNINADEFDVATKVIESLSNIFVEFLSIRYTHCAKEILNTLSVAFNKFKHRSNPTLIKPLQIVDSWRVNEENFLDFRNEAEAVIGSAITAIGPEAVLSYLPLNLENPTDSQPGRAWLLPILRDHIKNAKLSTFVNELIPLINSFEAKYSSFPEESVQLRVFQTVVDQMWSTLPHFCELPMDLRESFTDEFASELCSLLYSKVELRTTICNSLKMLVESNVAYAEGSLADDVLLQERFPVEEAKKNLEYLTTKASNLLAVLFNIYTQTAADSRGYILEAIESYLKVTSQEDLIKTFNNVCGLLKDAMDKQKAKNAPKNGPQLMATLLDIIIGMVKYLPSESYSSLLAILAGTINSQNNFVQKRSYRIITKLSELESGNEALANHIGDIENIIISNSNSVQNASRATQLNAIKTVVNLLASDHLDFIVKIVAEIILATKDVNEKTRDLAFETLIAMGKKMHAETGRGVIRIEGSEDQPANISEFFKILSVGLIGESQHMVSSTITAYACLMFEFKDVLPDDIIMEIYNTVELYLTSNSREIAKSAIGFAKVCVLSLPVEFMRPKIPELLPKLLRWSHEHTGHFKAKVKHIIERLIRRFGYDFVEQYFPEEDSKLLTNLRKTRNRNKRNKEEGNDISSVPPTAKGPKFMSAFDEAVYDSSDNEDEASDNEQQGRGKKVANQYIIEKSGENPLDLLDSQTLAHISSTRPKKFKKDQKKRADAFSFDEDGKLIVKGKKSNNETSESDPLANVTNGINAYLDAVKTGPVRGQRNKFKFKKGSKEEGDFSDDEKLPKSKFTSKNKIGKNFKKNAGGKFKSRRKL